MRSTRYWLFVAIALVTSGALTDLARADRVQGFETGDPAVSGSIGDAGKVGTFQSQAPPEGTSQYLITTIGMMSSEDGLMPISGSFAVGSAALNTFFNGIGVGGFEGSGVLMQFTITDPGQTLLTFQYDFMSNEPFQSMPRGDFAFATIFDSSNVLRSSMTIDTALDQSLTTFNPDENPFQFHSGLQTLALSVDNLAPGTYTVGFGVVDVGTADHASGLLIDNIQLVPEPSTVMLAVAGAGLFFALRRKIWRA